MRFIKLFVLFALSSATALSAQPTGSLRWADSAQRVIHRAVVRGDLGGVRQAITLIDRALGAFPNDPLLLHYRGFATFRMGQLHAVSPATEDSATAYFESTLEWMDRSIALKPLAESHAVRSSAMGQLMGGSMLAGVRYGAAAGRADDQARALGGENPRVLLLQAIGTWFKPSMFGGGEDKARPLMARALAAFAKDHPAPGMPAWGYAEALAWHGQMEEKAGRSGAARAAYQQALTLEPDYGWVKYVLLPRLK
jgi:tetratricopeptide (TPR) repeat protein